MSVITNNLLLGEDGYNISRSVRLRSSASAYFNRTFGTPTSGNIFTWSGWIKRGTVGVANPFFNPTYSGGEGAAFTSSNQLNISCNGAWLLVSNQVFRDPSAWYHIVLVSDMGNATASLRFRVYVNGVEITSWATDARASYTSFPYWNKNGVSHQIGYNSAYPAYLDGYLTEVNFIDGQALTPNSFGETDVLTGVWKPKKYAGTYGTNGFYLNFSDNSNNTATIIGKDYSGNGNNWTPNNISVTSGATYDSMLDVPTMWADGGNGRGNYAVLNPIQQYVSGGASLISSTVTDGNLKATGIASSNRFTGATIIPNSGKYYCEWTIGATQTTNYVGLVTVDGSLNYTLYAANGNITKNTGAAGTAATYTANDVIGIAWDIDNSAVTFYKNGTSQSALTGVNDLARSVVIVFQTTNTDIAYFNAGQRPFTYTPPTGFKALNTQNLPDATIKKGNAYFDATTYTGDGTSPRSITNAGGMQPDLVWIKNRSSAYYNTLYDSVRGTSAKALYSNTTEAENGGASNYGGLYGYLSAFNSNGFQTTNGTDPSSPSIWVNTSGNAFVAWQWKESASAGFDIVTYTGTGSATTIAHSLGVAPKMMIVKSRNSAGRNWIVYHTSLGATQGIQLNLTGAASTVTGFWNNTAPTSSVFTVGGSPSSGYDDVNLSAATYVAYLFAEVAGYSKFGSYTGNGSTDGPFLYLGFKPAFILVKSTTEVDSWRMYDKSRLGYNSNNSVLYPNLSNAEGASTDHFDLVSNGAKIRSNNNNTSGQTYIYAAFAENPFKNSLAR